MVDFSQFEIPIFTGINDQVIAPTSIQKQNISYLNQKYNTLLSALQTFVDRLNISPVNDLPQLKQSFTLDFTQGVDGSLEGVLYTGNFTGYSIQNASDPSQFQLSLYGTDSIVVTEEFNIENGKYYAVETRDIFNGDYFTVPYTGTGDTNVIISLYIQ